MERCGGGWGEVQQGSQLGSCAVIQVPVAGDVKQGSSTTVSENQVLDLL